MIGRIPRNAVAFVVIVVAIAVFLWTIGYPQWREHLGRWHDATNVAAGSEYVRDGVHWRLRNVPITLPRSDHNGRLELPESTRPIAVAFDRTKNGNPVLEADIGNQRCNAWAYVYDSEGRRWRSGNYPTRWSRALLKALGEDYDGNFFCTGSVKSLAIVALVPTDAEIVGAEVLFLPKGDREIVHFELGK
ncbi:hypothetical protein FZI91_21635 [Mycobacterium sp. CBMA271]|uniref:hypothetical protein n=1 Tax=unclassified Mycobacteroides TaxID=2618759 RepID=UPI0012DCD968|nr:MULTISPECIES: hypothetical protein [unclassified Mycobacteroides]MUM24286.1 hypothetical protein [Mycobacteroides sp. CBMA 271]